MLRLWSTQPDSKEFPVAGESMHPILAGIERVRARMGARRVRFGEIVLFYRNDRLIAHRALGRTARGYRTRGDAAKGFDGPLRKDEILGVATHLLWERRAVALDGFGSTPLRWWVGCLSLLAGWIRLCPAGPRPASRRLPRWRDALIGPPYRVLLRRAFRAYAVVSRAARRISRTRATRRDRHLLRYLRPLCGALPAPAFGERAGRRWVERAVRLGMAPVLLANLRELGHLDRLNPDDRRDLEKTYYLQALYNAKALQELAGLLGEMLDAGLAPVVLKGAALTGRVYPSVALRSLRDLDILVLPEEVDRADALLRRRGYEQFPTRSYAGHRHLAPYYSRRSHPRLEVHTSLIDQDQPFTLDIGRMLARSRKQRFGKVTAQVLCPEDQLIHACLHLALGAEFVRGIKDLADVDLLARSDPFDWNRVVETARTQGLGRVVYYCLDLGRSIFDTPVAQGAWAELRRERLPPVEHLLLRRLASTYVSVWSEPEEFFGLSAARRITGLLLRERRAYRRVLGILRQLVGKLDPRGGTETLPG